MANGKIIEWRAKPRTPAISCRLVWAVAAHKHAIQASMLTVIVVEAGFVQ
jgi:uncharacterized membrane-anchored protein